MRFAPLFTGSLLVGLLECKQPALIAQLAEHPRVQEALFGLFVAFLVYCYLVGSAANKALAHRVFGAFYRLLRSNFSYIGTKLTETETLPEDPAAALADPVLFERDYPQSYRVYLTGRASLKFAILGVQLQRRHDFVSSLVYSVFWPEKDRVQLEVALSDSCQLKGLLYAVRSKHAKKAIEDFDDLRALTRRLKPDGLKRESLAVFAEHEEAAELFFNAKFCALLDGTAGNQLDAIEFTDSRPSEFHKGANGRIVVSLGCGREEEVLNAVQLLEAFLEAVDRAEAYSPGAKLRASMEESRRGFAANRERQRKAAEGEGGQSVAERVALMTPAERRKFEEREARRAQQKKKMVKMVKAG